MPNSKARFIILKIVIAVMFAAVIWKLFDLQVLKGEQYYEIANDRMTTNIVEKAPRGEILDRYGTTLVSNKVGYSVVMQKTDVKDEEFNDIIKKLVDIFYSTQCEYYDDLPISFAPYQFKFEIIFTLQYSVRCLHIFVCVINAVCTLTKLTLIIASP